ncbi:purine and uridine phosphorylase [Trichoderma aethiopicum]
MDWNLDRGREVGDPNQPSPSYSRNLHSDYTVGWVCALPREQSAASFMLDEVHDPDELENPPHDSNSYIRGSIGRHKVVIACLPMGLTGTVSAASVATRMVATFVNIKVGLMVGIGGGMPQKNVRLGDVVISCPKGKSPGVVQWDAGKAQSGGVFQRTGSLNKPPTVMLAALSKLESHAAESHAKVDGYMNRLQARNHVPKSFVTPSMLTDVLYQSSYRHVENFVTAGGDNFESQLNINAIECALCDKTKTVERGPKLRDINFHYGLIVSGDQVIKDAQVRNKLYDDLYKDLNAEVLCVEMEAAGLMNDFPCIVIRGICDYADSHKNDAWQDYAACVAAAYAKALLDTLPPAKVDEMKTIQDILPPGFIEKARRFILPYLYSGQKSDNSVNSISMSRSF